MAVYRSCGRHGRLDAQGLRVPPHYGAILGGYFQVGQINAGGPGSAAWKGEEERGCPEATSPHRASLYLSWELGPSLSCVEVVLLF